MLDPFGIGLSDRIYDGEFRIGDHKTEFVSGTSILKFPQSEKNFIIQRDLKDQGEEFLADAFNKTLKKTKTEKVPILGLAQFSELDPESGRIVVYGDSNCVDSSHIKTGSDQWELNRININLTKISGNF